MAISRGPKLVTNGLVLALDASDNNSFAAQDLPVKNGLALWLDAADDDSFVYSSGTIVSQWKDKSGNNFHASQGTVASQPSRSTTQNSRKTVNFDGTNDTVTIPNFSCNSEMSIFVVSNCGSSLFIEQSTDSNSNDGFYIYGGGTGMFRIRRSSAASFTVSNNWLSGGYSIASGVNSTGLDLLTYINGTQQSFTQDYRASFSNSYVTNTLYIGSRGASSTWTTGPIAEIIIYNRKVTNKERNLIHTYLGQKWGIINTDKSIIDLSGNNYNGLLGNGTSANMPLLDYYNRGALKFDGSNDYITTGISGIVPTSTSPYTVSVWCYRNTNNLSYKELLAQWTNANSGNSFYFGFENSNVRFTDNWTPITVAGAGNTNVWMNLVGVYTVSNAYIYLNGVLIATKGSGFTYTGTGPLIIGRQGELNSEYFDGNIGNVLIYNRALTSAEISQNYNAQKNKYLNTIVQNGLVLNVDANNPYSYAGAGTIWYDTSGNSFNGTLTNGPVYSSTNSGIITFDGQNDYVDFTTSTLPISGNGARSIFVWMKTTATNNQGFVATGNPAGSQAFNLVKYSGNYVGIMGYNNDYYPSSGSSGISIVDGNWHYIGATFDGTNIRTYVDGILDNTSGTYTFTTTGQNNYIARSNHTGNENFLNGSVGLTQIYNRALSITEIVQNYNATKSRFGL